MGTSFPQTALAIHPVASYHRFEVRSIPAYCHNELMEPFEDRDSICIIWIHLIYAPTGGGKYAV